MEYGIRFGIVYSVLVLILRVVHGPEFTRELGVPVFGVALTYLVGGIVGGLTVGVLLPIGRWLAGSVLLGFLGSLPAIYGLVLLMAEPTEWFRGAILLSLITAATLGSTCGALWWFVVRRIR